VAVAFVAKTSSRLALLPLEDAIAAERQPNMPGTVDQYPNWRHRYGGAAAALLDDPDVRHRIEILVARGAS
jgi:4-alpha-glucanotransferase